MANCANKGAPKPTEIMQHANLQVHIQVVSCINQGAEHLYFPPNAPELPRTPSPSRDLALPEETKMQKCYVWPTNISFCKHLPPMCDIFLFCKGFAPFAWATNKPATICFDVPPSASDAPNLIEAMQLHPSGPEINGKLHQQG